MSPVSVLQGWYDHAVLVPIPGPEQPLSPPEDTRRVDQSLRAQTQFRGSWVPSLRQFLARHKPRFTEHRHCTCGIVD